MNNIEKQNRYAEILDILESMKTDVVSSCTSQLMVTGVIPEASQEELRDLSQLTGAVIGRISKVGVEVVPDGDNGELVCVNVGGKKYSCAKCVLPGNVVLQSKTTAVQLDNTEPASVNQKESEEGFEKLGNVRERPVEEEHEASGLSRIDVGLTKESYEERYQEESTKKRADERKASLQSGGDYVAEDTAQCDSIEPAVEEAPTPAPAKARERVVPRKAATPNQKPAPTLQYDDELVDDDDFGDVAQSANAKAAIEPAPVPVKYEDDGGLIDPNLTDDDDFDGENESPVWGNSEAVQSDNTEPAKEYGSEETPEVEDARSAVLAARAARESAFEEESVKSIGSMVYNMSKLSVVQIGGGRPEEVVVMIAPLKISKVSSPAVPIVVALFNRGKVVTKTSYDMGDGGKAIVTVDINEMYFLCRGSFDDDGKFKAMITTTGISSSQGVKLNVISSKNYGNGKDPEVRNGHVKVRYDDESGNGTIEVFPFGTQMDDEFIVLAKNPEFCDSYYVSQRGRGGSSVKIPCKDGWIDVVPSWNGDVLEVELFDQ